MMIIRMALILNIRAAAEVRIRMLLPLFSATSLEIEMGMERVAIVKRREYVGVAIV